MGVQYAVYHSQKGKGSGGGLGNHIDRTPGKEHSFLNANPNRIKLNTEVILPGKINSLPLEKSIDYRIKEGYKGKKAIRKDAVKYVSHILTGSHDKMKELERNPNEFKKWMTKNLEFMKSEFGTENIVRFTLHRDERTPHIHCITVPITKDGRLSAKELIGNKKDMETRQDRYGDLMKEFGLERGVSGSKAKHQDVKRFYGNINDKKVKLERLSDELPKMTVKDRINPDKFIDKLKETINVKFDNFINEQNFKNTKGIDKAKEAIKANNSLTFQANEMSNEINRLISKSNRLVGMNKEKDKKIEEVSSSKWHEGISECLNDINSFLKAKGNKKQFGYKNNEIILTDVIEKRKDRGIDRGGGMSM